MWAIRGGVRGHPVLLYQYHPRLSAEIPLAYLRGYEGYLQTDGYSGHDEAGKQPGIVHVGSWAHARRKFTDAQKPAKKAGAAEEAINRIAKLYGIEKLLRAMKLSDEEFAARRKKEVEPILRDFLPWLQRKALQVPPSSLIGKATKYSLGQWEKLQRYLQEAFLTSDTNLVENAVRPFVLGPQKLAFQWHASGGFCKCSSLQSHRVGKGKWTGTVLVPESPL